MALRGPFERVVVRIKQPHIIEESVSVHYTNLEAMAPPLYGKTPGLSQTLLHIIRVDGYPSSPVIHITPAQARDVQGDGHNPIGEKCQLDVVVTAASFPYVVLLKYLQRFTIAHEFGHYLLHRESSRVFLDAGSIFFRDDRSKQGSENDEIEANDFAACLLMPSNHLRELLSNEPLDVHDDVAVRSLAAHFGISVQALTMRLTRLGLSIG